MELIASLSVLVSKTDLNFGVLRAQGLESQKKRVVGLADQHPGKMIELCAGVSNPAQINSLAGDREMLHSFVS